MSKQKFAVFDIDGTVFRWQLYHELFEAFAQAGYIDERKYTIVREIKIAWGNRLISFEQYETALVEVLETAIVGLEEKQLNVLADAILEKHGRRVYLFTSQLIKDLKQQGYKIIAISGSHQQLVERFARIHEIDIYEGRRYKTVDGKLTSAPLVVNKKGQLLKEIVAKHDLEWKGSYAVGDTKSDIALLELVENPIAFNPSRELRDTAIERQWTIAIERKSINYVLRPHNGQYILA